MKDPANLGGQATPEQWQALARWLRRGGDFEVDGGTIEDSPPAPDAFGAGPPAPPERVDRRALLKVLGASLALAGVSGCAETRTEKVLPYTVSPADVTPGIPRNYATSMELDGFATGLLVRSNDGRPTKVEGNPDHPASLGAAGVHEQASVLGLYDPDRARAIRHRTDPASFGDVLALAGRPRDDGGAGLRFLLEPTGSPLVGDLIQRVRQRHPGARFTFHSVSGTARAEAGGRLAFGMPIQPQYDLRRADVILSINADFLSGVPFHLRYARHFAERRRPSAPSDEMNRLYVAETTFTPTGATADHRLRRKPSELFPLLVAVALELAPLLPALSPSLVPVLAPLAPSADRTVPAAIARDLARRPHASLVMVGESEPPEAHALGYLLNMALRSAAFSATAPTLLGSATDGAFGAQSLADLAAEMSAGRVDTLVVVGGNPVYNAPADLELARLLVRVRERLVLGLYENETADLATWFIPAAHYLESWGDARAYDGTMSLVQPLIEPLFGGRTGTELLAAFAGDRTPDARVLLRDFWARRLGRDGFDALFEEALRAGFFAGSASPALDLRLDPTRLSSAFKTFAGRPRSTGMLELSFALDPGVHDGSFANNAWLQEWPRPITKLTWDNALHLSPATAKKLDLASEDMVELRRAGRAVRIPVLVVPGHADDAFTAPLGYGRRGAESVARGVGSDVYVLRTADAAPFTADFALRKLAGQSRALARNQLHFSTEDRPIALAATLAEWRAHPDFTADQRGPLPSLYTRPSQPGPQWAMTIDTTLCTGCGSCVLGCQSENNILVVGKEAVRNKREMHWLRIDTYFEGPPEAPRVLQEPMLCQHCEHAPCEYVCPVNATVHSPDGLNEMVYNRCVGTRFCSNNCPYKVRRFNWFDWIDHQKSNQGLVSLQRNPNVTVRDRGVMEKCTYCVQRIRSTEIKARNEMREIATGEIETACQQACPTRAIQFDSLTHEDSTMVKWRRESRAFAVLHELGTLPRTQYLAQIRNPNPEMGA